MFTKDAQSSTICRSEGSKYTWFSESIELRGISSEGLRHIVEFIYTGRIPISMTTVQNILAVARHMQIQVGILLTPHILQGRKWVLQDPIVGGNVESVYHILVLTLPPTIVSFWTDS